ncbi:MAGUK p55 subfamily member 6-like isoform X2 [Anopheles albimanus]|uniref:MAGUK p55 subfamily member 6-like isoform X2 n=1 Tax=Anopheles albimanus TaxID=7167 RepID=UPI00163FD0C4|nr:MAGUK p55 subfamily member 6-like isoform X2 [Anopheles albimanus]
MVHFYQSTAGGEVQVGPRKGTKFFDGFRSLFLRRNSKPPETGPQNPLPIVSSDSVEVHFSPRAPIADPEPLSEPSSLVITETTSSSAGPQHTTNNALSPSIGYRTVTIHLPHHGNNRYDIRGSSSARVKPCELPLPKDTQEQRKKVTVKSVKRRSFGKRINNLWSNFGLLRSSEKIVEFANGHAAFQHVRDNLTDLNGRTEANETDLVFLQGILANPAVTQLIKIQDKLEEAPAPLRPARVDNVPLLKEVIDRCSLSRNPHARELARIFRYPHFRALLDAHDEIGEAQLEKLKQQPAQPALLTPASPSSTPVSSISAKGGGYINGGASELVDGSGSSAAELLPAMPGETIKMVGIRRNPDEPLGLTVEVDEHDQLVVARIIAGGMIDRQGLLHPGDVILEVNGVAVTTPEELQSEISRAKESVTLKIGPSLEEEMKSARITMTGGQCYMRALFDYDPNEDNLLPCKEIGLSFLRGDILQIINVKDPNWWQAKHAGEEGPTGLIPSQELEERRQAYVPPEADFVHKIGICGTRVSKKKRKILYKTKQNGEFDKADLMLYEEVTKMPPFKRKTLVLVGVAGVGRRTLKNRLINSDPDKFGSVLPHTSRQPRPLEESGKAYWFTDREEMEQDIRENKFLEFGEHHGNLYGTHLDSIRDVIRQGKMCVLDCSPAALKILHNSPEFMPFVVFIAAPGMEQLKLLYSERRSASGSTRNLHFDRQSSIRFSSRRAKTLESLASLYEDDDLISAVEESALLQRKYDKYLDMIVVNEDFDDTFRQVTEALEQLTHEHQWVPVNWIY